jgi:hypothetical protein
MMTRRDLSLGVMPCFGIIVLGMNGNRTKTLEGGARVGAAVKVMSVERQVIFDVRMTLVGSHGRPCHALVKLYLTYA